MQIEKKSTKSSSKDFFKKLLNTLDLFSVVPLGGTEILIETVIRALSEKQIFTKEQDNNIQIRAKEASNHLSEAGKILGQLQKELTDRNQELQNLLSTIEDRKDEALHYEKLANVSKETSDAFRKEVENSVRNQLRIELEKGKTKKRIISAIIWTITLILGGIVGVIIQKIWDGNTIL